MKKMNYLFLSLFAGITALIFIVGMEKKPSSPKITRYELYDENKLFAMVAEGEHAEVQRLLADPIYGSLYRADLDKINTLIGNTPLTQAIINEDEKMVQILINAGVDPNIADVDGDYPSTIAAKINDRIFDMLMEYKRQRRLSKPVQ